MVKSVVKECGCNGVSKEVSEITVGTLFYSLDGKRIILKADETYRGIVLNGPMDESPPGTIFYYNDSERRLLVPKGVAVELCQE